MNTYVTINLNGQAIDKKFDTIDSAVDFAENCDLAYVKAMYEEESENDVLEIDVYDSENNLLEWQTSKRNPYSGDFEYFTWGIFGYNINEYGKATDSETLAELINSEEEARKIAETIKDKFSKFDEVCIESYLQTISENIGDVGESYIIYGEDEE